jgi:hypothetical protein
VNVKIEKEKKCVCVGEKDMVEGKRKGGGEGKK